MIENVSIQTTGLSIYQNSTQSGFSSLMDSLMAILTGFFQINNDGSFVFPAIDGEMVALGKITYATGNTQFENFYTNTLLPACNSFRQDPTDANKLAFEMSFEAFINMAPEMSTQDLTETLEGLLNQTAQLVEEGDYNVALGIMAVVAPMISFTDSYSQKASEIATSIENGILGLAWSFPQAPTTREVEISLAVLKSLL